MPELAISSKITLYILMALMGIISLMVLRFRKSFADRFLACPATIAGIILVFLVPRFGFFLLTGVAFWFFWANTMTTATCLRFEKPKITVEWLITFPFGSIVGLAYIIWTTIHFDIIY